MNGPLFPRVFLLGTGLIGGSLALDLKDKGVAKTVEGDDADPRAVEAALARGIIDQPVPFEPGGLSCYDLVILAVPVLAAEEILREGVLSPRTLLTDVGSVKAPLVGAWKEACGKGRCFRFVPGHPIAGDERSGPNAARRGLFTGARVILTPGEGTAPEDTEKVALMWKEIGAQVLRMDPEVHDRTFAWVSHLPHMAAYALFQAVLDQDPELEKLSGGGLRDFTRIAASNPRMWADIAFSNRSRLLEALGGLERSLGGLRSLVEKGDREGLERLFADIAARRRMIP